MSIGRRFPECRADLDRWFSSGRALAGGRPAAAPICDVTLTERIDKYQLIRKLGEGTFGVVYLGLDPVLSRHVAIKVLKSHLPQGRKRFWRKPENRPR